MSWTDAFYYDISNRGYKQRESYNIQQQLY